MPTTWHPISLAIWLPVGPIGPVAAATQTVSPAFGLPICISPAQAVVPASARSSQNSTDPVIVTLPSLVTTSMWSWLNYDRFNATMMSDLILPALA